MSAQRKTPNKDHQLFEDAVRYYEENLNEILATYPEGNYIVIRGVQVLGVFSSRGQGIRAGFKAYGNVPYLVREIQSAPREYHSFLNW